MHSLLGRCLAQVGGRNSLALNTYGTEVALVMVLGFIMNLVFAKIAPFKSVFLTGQRFLYFSTYSHGLHCSWSPNVGAAVLGGVILGLLRCCATFVVPAIS